MWPVIYLNGTIYYIAPWRRLVCGRYQGFVGEHNQTNRWYAGYYVAT